MNKKDLEICGNCGKLKWQHYEAPVLEGETTIFECEIVRDDCNRNYRFKKTGKFGESQNLPKRSVE